MRTVVRNSTHWVGLSLGLAVCLADRVFADEPVPAPSRSPKDADSVAIAAARRVWPILIAVEQSHVSVPTRLELAKAIAPTLCWPDELSSSDAVGEEYARCRDADEFVALFSRRWREERRPTMPIEQLVATVVKALDDSAKWGDFRLLSKKEHAVQEQFRGNRYVGLGVALSKSKSKHAQFTNIITGGPAQRFGIEKDAVILEVNGHSTHDAPLESIVDWIRGPVGTDVTLKIAATDDRKPERVVTLQRGFVRFDSVRGFDQREFNRQPLDSHNIQFSDDPEIGYLHLSDVTGSTLQELRAAEVKLRKAKVRAVVLDLRYGTRTDTFHQSRLVADGLLDGGTLWHWHERDAVPRAETADRECLFRGLPLVVAVDKSTSGPQAAIAAALQDAGRAVVVGTSPAFDGLVTTGVELADSEHVLEMATAKLIRPRATFSWPLKPDHETPVMAIKPDGSLGDAAIAEAKPSEPKPTVVTSKSEPTQASLIAELTDLFSRLRQTPPRPRVPIRQDPQTPPRPHVPIRQDPLDLARKVIRELIDASAHESKETTPRE